MFFEKETENQQFLGEWKLLTMASNGRIVIDTEDPTEERVVFYEFLDNGDFIMQVDRKEAKGNWSILDPNHIRLDMNQAGGLLTGLYYFMPDPFYDEKLVLKGLIGKDEMHIVLVK